MRELDFQFNIGEKKIGAPFHGLKAFFTTPQLSTVDKVQSFAAYHTYLRTVSRQCIVELDLYVELELYVGSSFWQDARRMILLICYEKP